MAVEKLAVSRRLLILLCGSVILKPWMTMETPLLCSTEQNRLASILSTTILKSGIRLIISTSRDWFTDYQETANSFAEGESQQDENGEDLGVASGVYPVFLRLRNPKVYGRISDEEKQKKIDAIQASLAELEANTKPSIRSYFVLYTAEDINARNEYRSKRDALDDEMRLVKNDDPLESLMDDRDEFAEWYNGAKGVRGAWRARYAEQSNSRETTLKLRDKLIAEGYDGVILKGTVYDANGVKTNQYVAFDPSQIKSALGNDGSFSQSTTDITKSYRSPIVKAGSIRYSRAIMKVNGSTPA